MCATILYFAFSSVLWGNGFHFLINFKLPKEQKKTRQIVSLELLRKNILNWERTDIVKRVGFAPNRHSYNFSLTTLSNPHSVLLKVMQSQSRQCCCLVTIAGKGNESCKVREWRMQNFQEEISCQKSLFQCLAFRCCWFISDEDLS